MEANGPPYELARHRVGVVDVFVHDWAAETHLYISAGTTRSVAEAAEHDGPAIYEGNFRRFDEDDGSIVEHHPHGGRCGYWGPDDTLEREVILLTRVEGTRQLSDSGDD